MRWAREHRGELVWAALTLCRAGADRGRPKGAPTTGSFESRVEVVGGILDAASVLGFPGNAGALRRTATDREPEWEFFVAAWAAETGPAEVGVGRLFAPAEERRLLDRVRGDKGERSRRAELGKALGQTRDEVVGGRRIVDAGEDHSGRRRYRREPAAGALRGTARAAEAAASAAECWRFSPVRQTRRGRRRWSGRPEGPAADVSAHAAEESI